MLCLALAVAIILAGCTIPLGRDNGPDTATACLSNLGSPPAPVTGIFVQPDDGYAPIVDELEQARCAIDLTIYMLTDDTIFSTLIDAAARGVRVRVFLDKHPFGMFGDQQEAMDRLLAGEIEVQWGASSFQFTHAKYMVIDSRVALIMNQNLTRSAFDGNREFGVLTTSPDVVAQAQQLFTADWTGESAAGISGPLIVSPETSRTKIVALINNADESIDFYAEVIRDEGIIAVLRDAVQRGVSVRLIVNSSVDPADLDALAELSSIGVQVRMMEIMYIHSKTMLIDGDAALIGSQNYTMTSLDRNREVGMVVDDPALVARVTAIYERDWLRAIPASVTPETTIPEVITLFDDCCRLIWNPDGQLRMVEGPYVRSNSLSRAQRGIGPIGAASVDTPEPPIRNDRIPYHPLGIPVRREARAHAAIGRVSSLATASPGDPSG